MIRRESGRGSAKCCICVGYVVGLMLIVLAQPLLTGDASAQDFDSLYWIDSESSPPESIAEIEYQADSMARLDWSDPHLFVSVYEVCGTNPNSGRRPIYDCRRFRASGVGGSPVSEVDSKSRIFVTFDREWLFENFDKFFAAISMESSAREPVAVPGYSEIGKEAKLARSGSQMKAVVLELQQEFLRFLGRIDPGMGYIVGTPSSLVSSQVRPKWENFQRLLRDSTRIARLRVENYASMTNLLSSRFSVRLKLGISLEKLVDSAHHADSSRKVFWEDVLSRKPRYDTLVSQRNLINDSLTAVSSQIDHIRRDPDILDELWRIRTPQLLASLIDDWIFIEGSLATLLSDSTTWIVDVLADAYHSNPVTIRNLLIAMREMKNQLLAMKTQLLATTADEAHETTQREIRQEVARKLESLRSIYKKLVEKITGIVDLEYEWEELDENELKRAMISNLKNAEIVLPTTNLKPGDQLTLTIGNGVGSTQLSRELKIVVRLSEHGPKFQLTDSFMFLKRRKVPKIDETAMIAEAQESGQPVLKDRPVNFEPVAGVTFGLSWFVRGHLETDNSLQKAYRSTMRFIRPSLGINVSFPRFGTRIAEFVPAQSQTSLGEIKLRDQDVGTGSSVGFSLGFFDGAIFLNYGWMLSPSESRRAYWGIGFQFIKAVKGVASIAREAP